MNQLLIEGAVSDVTQDDRYSQPWNIGALRDHLLSNYPPIAAVLELLYSFARIGPIGGLHCGRPVPKQLPNTFRDPFERGLPNFRVSAADHQDGGVGVAGFPKSRALVIGHSEKIIDNPAGKTKSSVFDPVNMI
jgi:hypothetical protein